MFKIKNSLLFSSILKNIQKHQKKRFLIRYNIIFIYIYVFNSKMPFFKFVTKFRTAIKKIGTVFQY